MTVDYKTVSAKLGNVKPETRSISKEIFNAAEEAGHEIWYMWGMGTSSEHATGLALDLMVRNEAAGDWIRNYIWRNRSRLRLRHVIWEQHITSTVTSPGARRKMADRGDVTQNHMDHVHVLFFAGNYQAPESDPETETEEDQEEESSEEPAKPSQPRKSVTQIANEVIAGIWGNGDERTRNLRAAGYDSVTIQRFVNLLLDKKSRPRKTVSQIANEVIEGKWGNGNDRISRLSKAGYNPYVVQGEVNRQLGVRTRKSVNQLATEVIEGKWGSGEGRKFRLTRAGYDYEAVQQEVNRRM